MSSLRHALRFRRDHTWTPPHLSAYLDSDLSARARARLQRHTAECPECRNLLEDLRRMLALLHGTRSPEPVAGLSAAAGAVMRRLHEPTGH